MTLPLCIPNQESFQPENAQTILYMVQKKLQINYLDRDRYKIYHFVGSISRANNQQLLTEVEVSIHHFHPNEVIIVSVYVGFVT